MKRVLLAALLCAGCDPIVERATLSSVPVVGEVDCEKLSLCYTCTPGFNLGKAETALDCGIKLSPLCPGKQAANLIRTTEQRWHKSGATSIDVSNLLVSRIGPCQ